MARWLPPARCCGRLFDWITAGDPLYSFTGTRDTVETLERQTGPVDLVLYGPRRLGEVLQWPGMIGAAGGVVLCLAFLRRRAAIGVAAAALALLAFAILASCRPGDHPPLHDARGGDPGRLLRRWRCSAGACSTPAIPGGGAGRPSRRSSR